MWPWAMTLILDFEGQIFEKLYHRNKRVDWPKRMWIHRMLDPSCDFKPLPQPWPWPWIFKVKFSIDIFQEWEGQLTWNERDVSWIQCWMHNELPLGPQCMANRSVSKLLAHEWAISSLIYGAEWCCRSLTALLIDIQIIVFEDRILHLIQWCYK